MKKLLSRRDLSGNRKSSGQALLLIVLVVAAALIVVMSVVSKSVTDVAITSTEEDSLRAFSAAEAGVEEVLLNLVPGGPGVNGTVGNSTGSQTATFIVPPVTQDDAGNSFNYPDPLQSGDTGTIWFASRNNFGAFDCGPGKTCTRTPNLKVCWGTNPSEYSAVEVTVFYDSGSPVHFSNNPNNFDNVKAYTFAADSDSSHTTNNIDKVGPNPCTIGIPPQQSVSYRFQKTFNLSSTLNCGTNNCLIMAKVRLLYNTTTAQNFGLETQGGSTPALPAQGFKVTSAGSSGSTKRQVEVFQGYPEPPSIFDSTLFSLKGLEKK